MHSDAPTQGRMTPKLAIGKVKHTGDSSRGDEKLKDSVAVLLRGCLNNSGTAGLFAVRKTDVSNSKSQARSLVSRSVASDSSVCFKGRREVCE